MCIWGSNIRTIWSSSSTASSLFLYNIKITKLQVEFCNSKVSFILVYQSSLLILLQQVSHIFSLWSCFEFAPSVVTMLLSISRILQESDIDIEYFFSLENNSRIWSSVQGLCSVHNRDKRINTRNVITWALSLSND